MVKARDTARAAGRRVSFTLSDTFCVERHHDDFRELASGGVDLLFANEAELKALHKTDDFDTAATAQRGACEISVVTRSEKGAVVLTKDDYIEVPAQLTGRIVDTTGAGDLFAAGFLAGIQDDRPLRDCAVLGTVAAGEVISHFGARPQTDLKALGQAVRHYYATTGKPVTYEYCLFSGVNDTVEDARNLARIASWAPCKVNLIMYNPVEGTDFRSSDEPTLDAFIGELVRRRVRVTVRRSRGQDIDAACGQLAGAENG